MHVDAASQPQPLSAQHISRESRAWSRVKVEQLTMSCRESDSHMTEASRCGPHTASSECRCAYAPPSPFPNSPASRGQTIPADRCGPSMPSPSNVMRAHQQQPARWHACPSNGMHACVPANSPSARITSALTSSPQPLPTRLSTRLPYRSDQRATIHRATIHRATIHRATIHRATIHAGSRAHQATAPTKALPHACISSLATRPPRRGAHHGAFTTRAPASGVAPTTARRPPRRAHDQSSCIRRPCSCIRFT